MKFDAQSVSLKSHGGAAFKAALGGKRPRRQSLKPKGTNLPLGPDSEADLREQSAAEKIGDAMKMHARKRGRRNALSVLVSQ